MKKRMLSIILTVCMIMSAFAAMSVTASIIERGECGKNLTWTFDYDDGTFTISGTGDMWDGYMPWYDFRDEILSLIIKDGVTSICGFSGCSNLTNITIPNSVTYIGGNSFSNCSSLTNIIIPNSITSITGSAFSGCSSLTDITIPDSITSIGFNTFSDCSSLTNITIPNSVTSIGSRAFEGCSNLTDINIPDSVTYISSRIFEGCSSLTDITISDNVTSIGYRAFYGCSSLTNITIPDNVTSIDGSAFYNTDYYNTNSNWKNGILYIGNCLIEAKDSLSGFCKILEGTRLIATAAFSNCKKLSNIIIPDSVTSIGYHAFEGCSSLTSITIPDSVTSIGYYTFYGCSSLTSITIPDSVTYIGTYTFSGCSSLTDITIPNGVTYIKNDTFYGCTNLKSITIPKSIIYIEEKAFYNCEKLTDVYYLSNRYNWNRITIEGYNPCLNSATIHCTSVAGKISSIKYDGAKVSGTVNFDYSDEEGTLYLAVFDKSGRLEKFVKYDVPKGLKSQDFEIPVADANGHSLKAMFWNGNYTPLGISDEVTIK